MLKLIGLHFGRTLSRILATLILLPLAAGEAFIGLWIYDGAGELPMGMLFSGVFIAAGVLLVVFHHYVGREIDNWSLGRTDRRRLRQRLRGRPRLRAFAMRLA